MFNHRIARLRAWFKKTSKTPVEPVKAILVPGPRVQVHMRRAARKAERQIV